MGASSESQASVEQLKGMPMLWHRQKIMIGNECNSQNFQRFSMKIGSSPYGDITRKSDMSAYSWAGA
jgi:hypothetical protein